MIPATTSHGGSHAGSIVDEVPSHQSEDYGDDSFIEEDSLANSKGSSGSRKGSSSSRLSAGALNRLRDSPNSANVEDVCGWLSSLGLSEYRATFRAEAVDGAMLLELNEDLVKVDLGIQKMGHRRKILRERDALLKPLAHRNLERIRAKEGLKVDRQESSDEYSEDFQRSEKSSGDSIEPNDSGSRLW